MEVGAGAGRFGGSFGLAAAAPPPNLLFSVFMTFMALEAVLSAFIIFCGVMLKVKPPLLLAATTGGGVAAAGCGCRIAEEREAGAGGAGRELGAGAGGARRALVGLAGRL